jgi:hypothetical protein
MYHSELEQMLTEAVNHANALVADKLVTLDDVQAIFTDATKRIKDNVESKSFAVGNAYTGDVSGLDKICTITSVADNWVKGYVGKFKFCAKIFNEQSTYGISDGRISKLQICDTSQEHWGFDKCYINYSRGWDIRPTTKEALAFLNKMLEALGDDEVTKEELFCYDMYVYETVKDFENSNVSDCVGSFTYKEDAIEEAKEYPEYERIKIVSSDGKEIEIIENEPIVWDED